MVGTIAVVDDDDDDDDVRDVFGLLLETAGHTVRPYPSGNSLLSDNAIERLDCVIIDQNMPGLNGTDFAAGDRASWARLAVRSRHRSVGSQVTAAAQ
jgi:FixJ family two-component response regulator